MAYKRNRYSKVRHCRFCKNEELVINYKNIDLLKRFTAESGKLEARRNTGNCAKHQRKIAREIKKARQMALLPFVVE